MLAHFDHRRCRRLRPYIWLIATIAASRYIAFIARMNIVPFYPVLMERFSIQYTEVGAIYTAFFVGYSLSLIPSGAMADRFHPRRQLTVGLLLLVGLGLALPFAPSLTLMLVLRAGIGFAVATVYTACLKMLAIAFDPAVRGKAVGVMEIATGMGMYTALTVFPWLSPHVGSTALLLTLPALALGGIGLLSRVKPFSMQVKVPLEPVVQPVGRLHSLGSTIFFVTATNLLGLFTINGILGWISTYLTVSFAFTPAKAGFVTGLILLAQMIAVFPGGLLSDRLGRRLPVIHTGTLMMIAGILLLLTGQALYLGAILLGIGMAWGIAPMVVLATELFPPARTGVITAFTIAVAQAGSGLAGVLFGWLLDTTGSFETIWWTALGLAVLRLVTASLIQERRRQVAG